MSEDLYVERVEKITREYTERLEKIGNSPEHMQYPQGLYANALYSVEMALAIFVRNNSLDEDDTGLYSAILGQLACDLAMGMLAEHPSTDNHTRTEQLMKHAVRLHEAAIRMKLISPIAASPLVGANGKPFKHR